MRCSLINPLLRLLMRSMAAVVAALPPRIFTNTGAGLREEVSSDPRIFGFCDIHKPVLLDAKWLDEEEGWRMGVLHKLAS